MPAIHLTSEDKRLFTKRYYHYYGHGGTVGTYSSWGTYRWLLFLIFVPVLGILIFILWSRYLAKRNRRRIEEGTLPVQQWNPQLYAAQQLQPQGAAQGFNGQYYEANQQLYGNGNGNLNNLYYNKEYSNDYSSNAPAYQLNTNGNGFEGTDNLAPPNLTYQRPSGPPPTTNS